MTFELPIFDSMAACASATGIPKAVLRAAKRQGCPAFRSNRVALGPFLTWYFSRPTRELDDGTRSLEEEQARLARIRADLLDIQRRERERELVPLAGVQRMALAGWGPCRDAFNSLPTAVDSRANPSDPPHARAALTEWLDSVLPQIRAGMEAAFAIDLPDENDTKSAPKNHQDDPMVLPSTKPKRVRKR